jgi:tetratricopeptide (TPR) repeat protein
MPNRDLYRSKRTRGYSSSILELAGFISVGMLLVIVCITSRIELLGRLYLNLGLVSLQQATTLTSFETMWYSDSSHSPNLVAAETSLARTTNYDLGTDTKWFSLGVAHLLRGNKDSAIATWDQIEDRARLYKIGRSLEEAGELDLALHFYDQALKYESIYVGASDVFFRMAYVNHRLKQPPDLNQAQEFYKRAIHSDTYRVEGWQRPVAYNYLGAIYAQQERYDQAVTMYRTSIAIYPGNFYVHYNLALALWRSGKSNEAELAMLAAIKVDPSQKAAYQFLGQFYQAGDNICKAVEMYEIALELDPQDEYVRNALNELEQSCD